MTPEKFFDYLEGKLPPAERERLERALISDPELQRELFAARQIHRAMQRPTGESVATTRAGSRGRQVATAFAVLVTLNVALGLFFIFRANKPPAEVDKARIEALRQQLQSSLEKSAAAAFTPPTIGMEQVPLTIPRTQQEEAARTIIDAATKAGGSATKGLPNDTGFNVFVLIPGSGEQPFREALARLGAKPPPALAVGRDSPHQQSTPPVKRTAAALPNEMIHLEVILSSPP